VSVFCICYWPSSAQSFLGPSPFGLATIFYCLRCKASLFVASYDSQGHVGGILPESRYIASAPTAQKTPSLLLKLVYRILHSNGGGADCSEFIVELAVVQQRAANTPSSKIQFYCCAPFEVSVA
jgi:hypothetical protein